MDFISSHLLTLVQLYFEHLFLAAAGMLIFASIILFKDGEKDFGVTALIMAVISLGLEAVMAYSH